MYNLLAGHAGLKIGADVLCGPYVSVNGYAHNFSNDDIPINGQGGVAKQIEILHNTYVATRSTILAGPIGPGAVIGAHSLVTDPVEPNSIVHGVPAKHVRFMN